MTMEKYKTGFIASVTLKSFILALGEKSKKID